MSEVSPSRFWQWFCGLLAVLLLLVFFKNAWVCDDAYINFRSLEQLYAGNGPNWNPHQRVQAYTSPLWYWMLAIFRFVSPDHFFNVILLSLIAFLMLGMILQRHFGSGERLTLILLLAAASNAFFDFTTSGLENILCYLLLATGILSGFASERPASELAAGNFRCSLFAFSLVGLCRHDLLLLALPPAMMLIGERNQSDVAARRCAGLWLFLPLAVWSLFSLTYYGALFPNTAYAKLMTGIGRVELIIQGCRYLQETLFNDPITIMVLGAGILAGWFTGRRYGRSIAFGILLYVLYVVWVGGDFMRGRFLSVPFFVSLLVLAESGIYERIKSARPALVRGMAGILVIFLFVFPHTPVNTGLGFQDFSLNHGIADERGYYFDVCSLYAYLYSQPGEIFPDFEWSQIGRQIAGSGVAYLENDFNGMLGFWAGTRPIIIDRLALTDPFLARLPVSDLNGWRIGHFKREVPAEYRKSIESGKNCFSDASVSALYENVLLATQDSQLFTLKRLLAIVKLNTGWY